MNISGKTKLCVIIGDPVEHSLSPAMHNAAYKELGIDDEFVFVAARVNVKDVQRVTDAVRAMNIRGLTCTIPHKLEVMKYLDEIDPVAQKIGAVNTVVNNNGVLKGYNTDWLGVTTPVLAAMNRESLNGLRACILGAGGAARAAAYGLREKGADVTIANRTIENAQLLADELGNGTQACTLTDVNSDYDILVNTTPLGMHPHEDISPVSEQVFKNGQIVLDAVYVPYETTFLKQAKQAGTTILHGIDMLLYQGTAQFELYTGKKAPEKVMRQALLTHFGISL